MAIHHGQPSAVSGSQAAPVVITPEHLARLLALSRASSLLRASGACEHAEIATIAAERARALTGASATQLAGLSEGGGLAVLAEAAGGAQARFGGGAASGGPSIAPASMSGNAPRARAEAETVVGLRTADALVVQYVVQYDEIEVDGPVTRVLGVFSSERSARDALRKLDLARSLVIHASITSWTLDVPRPWTRVEVDLPESPG